jgi:hypothetical protein
LAKREGTTVFDSFAPQLDLSFAAAVYGLVGLFLGSLRRTGPGRGPHFGSISLIRHSESSP